MADFSFCSPSPDSKCGLTRTSDDMYSNNTDLVLNGALSGTQTHAISPANRKKNVSRFQLLGVAFLLLAGTAAHAKKTFYFANDGDDANNGTSAATPWKTIAKANSVLPLLGPSDSIRLRRGDVFRDDYIRCMDTRTVTAGMDAVSSRPTCSGKAGAPVQITYYGSSSLPAPIIDGADPLALTWTLVGGTTWEAKVTGPMPSKLYVDAATKESQQLLPVPNVTGGYVASATYNLYDGVTYGGALYIRGAKAAAVGIGPNNLGTWISTANDFVGNRSQNFSNTNSGEQNVEVTPGSWYGSGSTILVNLADGSDPNNHTFEGTQRSYGIVLSGVNYVTVRGLAVEHTLQTAILSAGGPSLGTYFTGEHNRIVNNSVWNYGSIVGDSFALGNGHTSSVAAGIMMRASGDYNPHLIQGAYVGGNYVGTMDAYFSMRQAPNAGIDMAGIDGGGTANNIVAEKNYIRTVNTRALVYDTAGLYLSPGQTLRNLGGRITNNEMTNSQGNLFFTTTEGGMEDHNRIHHSYGEGVQTGGNSISTSTEPQIHAFDLIYDLGEDGNLEGFNGFDCNAKLDGGYWLNNTVYNVYGGALTFETGCTNVHVHNNIMDQNALAFPDFKVINYGHVMYYDIGSGDVNPDFSNNVWVPGPQFHPFFGHGKAYKCAAFFSAWPDKNSFCTTNPGFTSPDVGKFDLAVGSPAMTAAENGAKAGALQ